MGEDQPLCPDLPELDLSELDVSDLDADSFLGGLKWYSDQSEIISSQYGNEASNLFEVRRHVILFPYLHGCLSKPNCMIYVKAMELGSAVSCACLFIRKTGSGC